MGNCCSAKSVEDEYQERRDFHDDFKDRVTLMGIDHDETPEEAVVRLEA